MSAKFGKHKTALIFGSCANRASELYHSQRSVKQREKSTNAIRLITRPRMSLEIEGTLGFDSDSLGVRIWA